VTRIKIKPKRYKWDAFICHAIEDKTAVVAPLFHELQKYGVRIWYAPFSVKVGDSLRQIIEKGLVNSRFGIVVFSSSFFSKKWPQSELDGLFDRETNRRKVILPIWHEVDEVYLREKVPMLVGRWAAKTSEGIPQVARQLVEVIRPKALKLDVSRTDAQRANTRLLDNLHEKNPTRAFRVVMGQSVEPKITDPPQVADAIASFFDGTLRIDVLAKDVKTYMEDPVKFSVKLAGSGVTKFLDFVRTGRSQEFTGEEIKGFETNLEFSGLDTKDFSKSRLYLGPARGQQKKVPVRVTFGSGQSAVTILFMESMIERAGTDEICLLTSATDFPFSFQTVIPRSGMTSGDFEFRCKLAGEDVHVLQKYFGAMMTLQESGDFEIRVLQTDTLLLKGKCSIEKPSVEDIWYGKIINDVASVADHLGLTVKWPENITAHDIEVLAMLTAFVNQKPIGTGAQFKSSLVKSEDSLRTWETVKEGGQLAIVREEDISFFGTVIKGQTLAFYAEYAFILDFEETQQRLEKAAIGESVEISYRTSSPITISLWDKILRCPKPANVDRNSGDSSR